VAFGQYYRRLEHHHLARLCVNPKYRGQGLAKILVTRILEQAYLEPSAKVLLYLCLKIILWRTPVIGHSTLLKQIILNSPS
jgi:GNAT superfamily N-acetyltransferase